MGQYKILQEEQRLHPYLAPSEQFSKESLFSMLASYQQIIVKPAYGTGVITISFTREGFHINTNGSSIVVSDKEAVYTIVQQEMNEQNYVIQPQWTSIGLQKRLFCRFITIHKYASNWKTTFATKHSNHFLEWLAYKRCYYTIKNVALLVARQLGSHYTNCESIVIEVAFNLKGEVFIYDTTLHYPISKWNQYQPLHHFMPHTDLLTEATFENFLKWYGVIFLKPCNGQHGKDIIKIVQLNTTMYEVYIGISKLVKQNMIEVYEYIQQMGIFSKNYIIQQGIPLLTVDGCFMDIRVMTQKVDGDWQVTGKAVKVAGHLFFTTNAARAILTLEEALEQTVILPAVHEKLSANVDAICLAAVKELEYRDNLTIVGFDVGVTDRGEIGIIEGNYVPDISLFKRLEDKTMYNTIVRNRNIVKKPSEQS